MLSNQRTPAYYQGVMAGDGLGSISAIYPDGSAETLPVPTDYVIDGFTWASATTESGRAAAASLLCHLANHLATVTVTDQTVQRLARVLIAVLPAGQDWRISSLDLYLHAHAPGTES